MGRLRTLQLSNAIPLLPDASEQEQQKRQQQHALKRR